jgi:hypothetical protein
MLKVVSFLWAAFSVFSASAFAQESPEPVVKPDLHFLRNVSLGNVRFDRSETSLVRGSAYAFRFQGQNPSDQEPDSARRSGRASSSSGFGATRWLGLALVAGGGAMIAHGAMISDPCSSFAGPGVLCASNYQTVRTSYMATGGSTVGLGLLFLFVHHH